MDKMKRIKKIQGYNYNTTLHASTVDVTINNQRVPTEYILSSRLKGKNDEV